MLRYKYSCSVICTMYMRRLKHAEYNSRGGVPAEAEAKKRFARTVSYPIQHDIN